MEQTSGHTLILREREREREARPDTGHMYVLTTTGGSQSQPSTINITQVAGGRCLAFLHISRELGYHRNVTKPRCFMIKLVLVLDY